MKLVVLVPPVRVPDKVAASLKMKLLVAPLPPVIFCMPVKLVKATAPLILPALLPVIFQVSVPLTLLAVKVLLLPVPANVGKPETVKVLLLLATVP